MVTLGCVILPSNPPSRFLPLARAADAAGLEEVWLWEDCFRETGVAGAAGILGATSNLRVGVGVLPVPLRNVALTAMEIATLEGMFPGRFLPGIGHGVLDWMGQVGARAASPLTLLREYATALRALLAGERLTVSGRYVNLDDVVLDWPPATAPRVLAAAQGPKTLRLVGEVADGVVITADTGLAGTRDALLLVEEGRAAAGRTDPFRVVANVSGATGDDAVERLRAQVTAWGIDVSDDEKLAGYAIWGDADEFAAGIRRFAEAGVDTVVIQPTADDPDQEGLLRFLGEKVRPLVS